MPSNLPPSKTAPVLIVGAGVFGLSAAYHLSNAGYSNITVLDRALDIPSPLSAGNDVNKIVRADYPDPFYIEAVLEAMEGWRNSPIFKPYYYETGLFLTLSSSASQEDRETLRERFENVRSNPAFRDSVEEVGSPQSRKKLVPQLEGEGWTAGYINRRAGYAEAGKAMRALFEELRRRSGVSFVTGEDGYATKLLYEETSTGQNACTGVESISGKIHNAETTILCLGARVAALLPSLSSQAIARAYPVAHVQLDEEDIKRLEGLPVVNCFDQAYFFPPDRETGVLKMSALDLVYTNFGENGLSNPTEDSRGIPEEVEERFRNVLKEVLPFLAERPLVSKRLCWCADSVNEDFIIDFVPGTEGLIAASGDSDHGFKMLPVVGKWIHEILESGKQDLGKLKWKNNSGSLDVGPSKELGTLVLRKDGE